MKTGRIKLLLLLFAAVLMVAAVLVTLRIASPRRAALPLVVFPPPDDQLAEVKIECLSNMKQVGLAVRIWEGDHGDHYPWNASTNQGGSLELCAIGRDGFDTNAALHFQVMSNELSNPLVLVCPQDTSKKGAVNFGSLGLGNVTYLLRTGTNVDHVNPREVMAVCPIDGNTLYCDGTVVAGKHKPR